jgi:hypothetical protein
MDPDTDDLKGRAKEAVGDLTDNDDLKREGQADRAVIDQSRAMSATLPSKRTGDAFEAVVIRKDCPVGACDATSRCRTQRRRRVPHIARPITPGRGYLPTPGL